MNYFEQVVSPKETFGAGVVIQFLVLKRNGEPLPPKSESSQADGDAVLPPHLTIRRGKKLCKRPRR
eukprot:2067083-Amphidinium_carterae.1